MSQFCRTKATKKLTEEEAYRVMSQVLCGVKYLHIKGVSHRDLKLTNILINSQGKVKIIDFGFASNRSEKLSSYCGTPSYMAPEIVERRSYWGKQVDMWALGVILYKLLTAQYAFGSRMV